MGSNKPQLCKHGILGISKCKKCLREKAIRLYHIKNPNSPYGPSKPIVCPHGILGISKCRECKNEYNRKWDKVNRAKPEVKAKKRLYRNRPNVKAHARKYHRTYRKKNKETIRKKSIIYRRLKQEEIRESNKARHLKNKLKVISYYSKSSMKCARCGCDDIRCLSIDHMNGGGNEHRKKLGVGIGFYEWLIKTNYPIGYQVLCMNCQFIKRCENHECEDKPHKKKTKMEKTRKIQGNNNG